MKKLNIPFPLTARLEEEKKLPYIGISIFLATLIFIFDYTTPLGIAGGVPYIAVVLIGLAARSPSAVLLFAGLSSVLVVWGLLLSPDPVAPFDTVMVNRALAIFAIWVTAYITYLHLRSLLSLQHLAYHDQLTGAYNRHYLTDKGSKQLKLCQRYRLPFSLIILDIDDFQKINDQYGHLIGDQFLKQIAGILQLQTRPVDTVCRYDGEEFAILLPSVALEEALTMAQRIQRALSASNLTWEAATFKPSVSIGVAELLDRQWGLDKLLTEAGRALHQAKALGYGRIIPIPKPAHGRAIS